MEGKIQQAQVGDYKLEKLLGQGLQGKVKLCVKNNHHYAIKIYKSFEGNQQIQMNLKEIMIMKQLKHTNIVNLVQELKNEDYIKKNGEIKKEKVIAFVMEYARGGELYEFLYHTGRFEEEVARSYFHELIDALEYIHGKGIVHRDLKPSNLLLDEDFRLKVADFGFADFLAGKDGSKKMKTQCGSKIYMAPELELHKEYEGEKVDIFAAGVILFVMYIGHDPFEEATAHNPFYKILMTSSDKFWSQHEKFLKFPFNKDFKDLITAMLSYQPSHRPTIDQIKNHPWYQGIIVSQEQIKQEFGQRKQKMDEQLKKDKQKYQNQQETKKNQTTQMINTRAGNFLSAEDVTQDFVEMENTFKNLNFKRDLKPYDATTGRETDLIKAINPDYLLYMILSNVKRFSMKEVEGQEIPLYEYPVCNANINDKKYQIVLTFTDVNHNELSFKIQVEGIQEDIVAISFVRITGNSLHYYQIINEIKNFILEI